MYVAVRQYQTKAGSIDELARRAQQGFVPLMSQVPGFVAYYGVDAGNNVIVTISIFQDQAGAEESNRRAADWVKQNLAELVQGPPEITAGEVRWGFGSIMLPSSL
jgi:hypothetical protein